eukprot:9944396-Alexandrium_andersonii.AAC.1
MCIRDSLSLACRDGGGGGRTAPPEAWGRAAAACQAAARDPILKLVATATGSAFPELLAKVVDVAMDKLRRA